MRNSTKKKLVKDAAHIIQIYIPSSRLNDYKWIKRLLKMHKDK